MNGVFASYGTSYFDLLSQRIDDNEAEITDIDFAKLNKPDPIVPNALLYVTDFEGNTASSEILCQSNNALQSVGCLQFPGTSVNPATIIPELAGEASTTVWLSSANGHLYRGSVDLESGGGGGGDVFGPAISNDNAIARFNTSTGKLLQNSLVQIDDGGSIIFPIMQRQIEMGVNTLLDVRPATNFAGVGRRSNNEDVLMFGLPPPGDSNNVSNGIFVGHNSCGVSSGAQTDVLVYGHDVGTPSGSKTIAIGNRICQLPTPSYSLGNSNLMIGHDIRVLNGSLGNLLMGSGVQVRGNNNTLLGENILTAGAISNSNTVIGYDVASSVTGTFNNNTIMGTTALVNAVGSCSGNVLIGESVASGVTTSVNDCLWIDAVGVDGDANSIRIGGDTKTECYITGIHGASSASNTQKNVKINSFGQLFGTYETRPFGSHSISYSNPASPSGGAYTFTITNGVTTTLPMGGTPTSNFSSDGLFTTGSQPGSFKYVGLETVLAKYSWSFAPGTGANNCVSYYLTKNGVLVPNTIIFSSMVVNNANGACFLVSVSTDDELQITYNGIANGTCTVFTENRFVEIIG